MFISLGVLFFIVTDMIMPKTHALLITLTLAEVVSVVSRARIAAALSALWVALTIGRSLHFASIKIQLLTTDRQ